jgi:AraC family transcriptional regulator
MSKSTSCSVTPKNDQSVTPTLPPCNVPYRWILHVGRCVSVYFDPHQPEAVWDEHQNPEIQVLYFGQGSDCTIYWIQDGVWMSRNVRAPSLWVIGPNVPHKLEWRRPALRLVLYLQLTFVGEFVGLEIDGSFLFPIEMLDRCNPKITEFLREFEQLEYPRNTVELLTVESSAHLAARHLFQAWNCLTGPTDAWLTPTNSIILVKVDTFIESHIDQKITLADMAREVGMSKTNFIRLFKKQTGITPGQHLINYRIQKSKTLLIEKDWNIGNIALEVGFSSQGHFDFYFKRRTGKTPKEFRISHQNGDIS